MASGGHPAPVEVAPRLQTAAENSQFSYSSVCTTPTVEKQVAATTVIPTELVGSSASHRGQVSSRQSSTKTGQEAESADTTLKVKVESCNTKDTASDSPLGEPAPPTTLPSSDTAIGLLDALLDRSRTVQRKLDRMTIPPAGGPPDVKTGLARGPCIPAGRPVPILDKCLA